MVFYHKNLDVYKVALNFADRSNAVVKTIPRGQRYLGDQLQRAASSIVLNIGEGAGEFSSREKARFYRMALRSASECASVLDLAVRFEIIDSIEHERCDALLNRIMGMLTKLIHRHSNPLSHKHNREGEPPAPLRGDPC